MSALTFHFKTERSIDDPFDRQRRIAQLFSIFEKTASASQVLEAQDAPAANPLHKTTLKREVIVTNPPFACKSEGVR